MPARVLIGTASWADKTLIDSKKFYPPEANTPEERLRFYASQFPLVEVDSPYYGLPTVETVQHWAERTPDGFTFDVKAYSLFTEHPTPVARLPRALKEVLPANAQITYLPASWNKAEAWPVFQRAYLTAQALGVADKAHEAMYEAIWKTGELGVTDNTTGRLKSQSELPTIEDAARFYQRVTGVKAADFVTASKSFGVDLKIRQADAQIKAMQVPSTPTLVINGKYRLNNDALRSNEEIIELVKFLVAKENAAK